MCFCFVSPGLRPRPGPVAAARRPACEHAGPWLPRRQVRGATPALRRACARLAPMDYDWMVGIMILIKIMIMLMIMIMIDDNDNDKDDDNANDNANYNANDKDNAHVLLVFGI